MSTAEVLVVDLVDDTAPKVVDTDPPCLASKTYTIEELLTTPKYQPHWSSVNKQIIADIATPPAGVAAPAGVAGAVQSGSGSGSGSVTVSRWTQPAYLPHGVKTTQVQSESGFFLYKDKNSNEQEEPSSSSSSSNNSKNPKEEEHETHWHVNFADPLLFGYAEGSLFAQDELQVVEHPILVSVGKAMADEASHGMPDLCRVTKDTNGATPGT